MKQITCPKCFARHPADRCVYICANNACDKSDTELTPDAVLHAPSGEPVCPACREALGQKRCPSCGYELCSGDGAAGSLGISIVGASGAGKSNFLSVLINSMKNETGKTLGSALYPLGGDNTIEAYTRQYYQPLYVHGQCIESTDQEDIGPLEYSLVFSGDGNSGKTCNLTFYDACGANFESVRAMEQWGRSIYHSGGILFLVDPSQFPVVRDQLIVQGKRVLDVDPVALLSRTIHLIRSGSGKHNIRKKIDIPIAICLTKLDTVRHLLDASSFLRQEARHLYNGKFDPVDFRSCDLEAHSLIESWGGSELISHLVSQFSTYAFFGFSALGSAPGDAGQIHHIAPHRVTDPLLWLLWKRRVIRDS